MKKALFVSLFFAGCATATPAMDGGSRDTGVPELCSTAADCDDSFACTIDACGAGATCEHTPIDERCATGESCRPGRGCVAETECLSAADCDDGVPCTLDMCIVGNMCDHIGVNERCPSGNTCDVVMGCVGPMGCMTAAECDDAHACTIDACGADMTCQYTALDERCPMGEICSPSIGCTLPCTADEECQDGVFCNGREICTTEFGCGPATTPRVCMDADSCTVDACDTTADMCTFLCNTADASCMCPTFMPTYAGTFDISPSPMQACGLDGMTPPVFQVDYNITEVTFMYVPTLLSVTVDVPRAGSASALTQMPAPMGPDFNVSTIVAGSCEEHYRLMGRFTDADTFTALWTAMYVEVSLFGCLFPTSPCMNMSMMVTGTRRP